MMMPGDSCTQRCALAPPHVPRASLLTTSVPWSTPLLACTFGSLWLRPPRTCPGCPWLRWSASWRGSCRSGTARFSPAAGSVSNVGRATWRSGCPLGGPRSMPPQQDTRRHRRRRLAMAVPSPRRGGPGLWPCTGTRRCRRAWSRRTCRASRKIQLKTFVPSGPTSSCRSSSALFVSCFSVACAWCSPSCTRARHGATQLRETARCHPPFAAGCGPAPR
mmetsp:Transcript_113351/g.325909  ORF Transcript_113351/g.325909 Transcript_113351/m.325909 type:complete len:219 (-) Transcript_113351:5-661(-)